VHFDFALLCPPVRVIVVANVAEQETGRGPMNDEPDVARSAHGPEVLVTSLFQLVELMAGMRGIHLQIVDRGLDGLLLFGVEPGETVGKRIGDAELHQTRKTFITSSPRWLMTLTAMRPDFGLSKGRDVSLWSVAQASWLISAFSVVLRAL
jgi:hypothetical protein